MALVQSELAGGSTAAGARVFLDRVDPLQKTELPAILIDESTDGETIGPYTVHGVDQRDLGITISCVVTYGSTAGASARALGLEVEKLLAASTALAALAKLGVQITNSRLVISGEQDRLMASREQQWRLMYLVAATAPDTIL